MGALQATIEALPGFRATGVHCGLKKDAALDFTLIVSEQDCVAAGIFTTNLVRAACVTIDQQRLQHNSRRIRAVAINSANANACTGERGLQDALATARHVAAALGCDEEQVLVLSTGVIGEFLAMDKIEQGVAAAAKALGDDWEAAACGMMTTDTRPKMASVMVTKPNGERYQVAGLGKGSGMIAPNMATMLGVIVTDVGLAPERAHELLSTAADTSFNRIVVDGDMSTNDTVLLLANGVSRVNLETEAGYAQFQAALNAVCLKLAQDIVRDGEGATKFMTLEVLGAPDDAAARQIANTIATSPLVKTAFFGADANWGRILAAAGRAGIELDAARLQLWLSAGETLQNPLQLVSGGLPTVYDEEEATAIMRSASVTLRLDCGLAEGSAIVWTCDLSHEYVSINADYRT